MEVGNMTKTTTLGEHDRFSSPNAGCTAPDIRVLDDQELAVVSGAAPEFRWVPPVILSDTKARMGRWVYNIA
jgi:hypothetical protein